MKFPRKLSITLLVALLMAIAQVQASDEPVTIGFIGTLSTPAGYIGQDQLDAFKLAVKQGKDGALGGVPVTLNVVDDGMKPSTGKRAARRMLQQGIRLFTGITFSNIMIAAVPTIMKEDGVYVSLNAGPSGFAGKGCLPGLFSVAMMNLDYSYAAAAAADHLKMDNIVLLALGYEAGRDVVEGFKEAYDGNIKATIYARVGQSDFSVEIARIRALQPDGIYVFLPGGPGINFAKQFANAGLKDAIKVIAPLYSMDYHMLHASGDAGLGFYLTTQWIPSLDNAANKAFVKAFEAEYDRRPTVYAATAYDTARLIGSALEAVDGEFKAKPDAFRAALNKADFDSVRGDFEFGPNQFPLQAWYVVKVTRDADGELTYEPTGIKVSDQDHPNRYMEMCKMDK